MIQKLITYTTEDLAFDPEQISNNLNLACSGRAEQYRISGICTIDNRVCFVLVPLEAGFKPETYVLAPGENIRHDKLAGTLTQRWGAGFNTVGSIYLDQDLHLMLYAKTS